jgi:hypothetical protein
LKIKINRFQGPTFGAIIGKFFIFHFEIFWIQISLIEQFLFSVFIVAKQFMDLKNGDRYFFENAATGVNGAQASPAIFTPQQLYTIKNQTLARLICNNFDSITTIQPQVLKFPDNRGLLK